MGYLLLVSLAWLFLWVDQGATWQGWTPTLSLLPAWHLRCSYFCPFTRFRKLTLRKALWLALDGFIQFGLMYIAYTAAFNYLKAYEVALFTIFTPIYVTLINDLFNRKFNPAFLLTALLAVQALI